MRRSNVVIAILNSTGFVEQVIATVETPNASCQSALEAAMRALDGALNNTRCQTTSGVASRPRAPTSYLSTSTTTSVDVRVS